MGWLPWLLLREPERREVEASPIAPFRIVAAELWSRRAFLGPLFAGQVAVVMADVAATVWVAPVLSRDFGLQPQQFAGWVGALMFGTGVAGAVLGGLSADMGQKSRRSEEHTSELQSLMRISYAVFCLKKKNTYHITHSTHQQQSE